MRTIILASASPRRKELLAKTGLSFKVVNSGSQEKMNPRLKPLSQVQYIAKEKANLVAKRYKNALIIAADTVVAYKDQIIGKPASKEEARRMLRKLNGTTHSIITGFTVLDTATNKYVTDALETKVFMRKLSQKEIDSYLEKENVMDKAGAYAIQELGAILFDKIEGDFSNAVGLPLPALAKALKKFGIKIL